MNPLVQVLVLALLGSTAMLSEGQSPPPNSGYYVPDEATAVRIAEAVFIPVYGEKHVQSERPFHARLQGDDWVVSGTLPKPRKTGEIVFGGTMVAEINRTTGCIKSIYHLK
ncbi:MAG TPA: NTF2 fold immunity protein [Candidatus Sulfotelmatobacter sp.]|nr:NTF2 fold immunity protein [Candidatus Sulfotelmatobacter sp.]